MYVKAQHKETGIFAALKEVEIKTEDDLEDFSIEIEILSECSHKNVVGLHEAFFFDNKLWMFIEFCGAGAVDSIMVDLEKPLNEEQIRYVCREMCEGLDFIHSRRVIHRDLKAGNVLLTMEGEVKLADFGVSALNQKTIQKRDSFIGTPYWMAPEVILCETLKDTPYNFKADIWSLGVTLIEFAQIEPPNHEMHPMRVLIKIHKADAPQLEDSRKWSKEFRDFLKKCLSKDPEGRSSARELLEHPFIRDVRSRQPILDLISEFKAEVVETVEDLTEEAEMQEIKRQMSGSSVDLDKVSVNSDSSLDKREKTPEKQEVVDAFEEPEKQPEEEERAITAEREKSVTPEPEPTKPKTPSPKKAPAPEPPEDRRTPTPEKVSPREEKQPSPREETVVPPQQESVVSPPPAFVGASTDSEDRLSDEGIGASADEKSDTSSQDEAPASVDIQIDITPLVGDIVVDIIDDVIRSTTEEPSVASVVLDIISSVISDSDDDDDDIQFAKHTNSGVDVFERDSSQSSREGSQTPSEKSQSPRENSESPHEISESPRWKSESPREKSQSPREDVARESSEEKEMPRQASVIDIISSFEATKIATDTERRSVSPKGEFRKQTSFEKSRSPSVELNRSTSFEDKCRSFEKSPSLERVEDTNTAEQHIIDHRLEDKIAEIPEDKLADVYQQKDMPEQSAKVNEKSEQRTTTGNREMEIQTVKVRIGDGDDDDHTITTTRADGVITINGQPVPAASTIVINGHVTRIQDIPAAMKKDRREKSKSPILELKKELDEEANKGFIPQTDLDTFETNSEPLDVSNPDEDSSDQKSDTGSVNTVDSVEKVDAQQQNDVNRRHRAQMKSRNANKSQYKTMTKTRTYMKDGQVVTSTTQRVILAGEENRAREEHFHRKQDMRELKMLQKNENKQHQDLIYKAQMARDIQDRKFDVDMQSLIKNYDQDMDTLTKQQKQQVEKAESTQTLDLKTSSKRFKAEQEKEHKMFKEKQKQDVKLMKQEFDMLAKTAKKEDVRRRREHKDIQLAEEERQFMESQQERLDRTMKQLTETHRQKIAMLESQFLQQKQQLLRAREAAIWELEKQQLHEKHQLAKSQLKDMFFLKRHQMLVRHQKEVEQMKRSNVAKEEEMQHRHVNEKRRLPKILKQESKTRSLMFKQSLRLGTVSVDDEKAKLKQFEENEKKRMKSEQGRQESKHNKQWEELVYRNETSLRELEQLQAEKRKILMEHETQKIKELDEQYSNELREWKARLTPRKQRLEEDFSKQRDEQEKFYGAVVMTGEGTYMPRSAPQSLRHKSDDSLKSRHSTVI